MRFTKSMKEKTAKAKSTPAMATKEVKSAGVGAETLDFYGVRQAADGIIFVTLCPKAASVQIAGDFNNWQPERNPMQKVGDEGIWRLKLRLSPGTYRYRLVVDRSWQQDPCNSQAEPNPYGGLNSVFTVK